jgi:hypothetical protein
MDKGKEEMNEAYWNTYYYQIVREHPLNDGDTGPDDIEDEWRIYTVKAMGNDHARRLADEHMDALNAELVDDKNDGEPIPWRKQWQLHAYGKLDLAQLNKGFPVLLASYQVPMSPHSEVGRSDITPATNLTR